MTDRAVLLRWLGARVRALLAAARARHPETLEDSLTPGEVLELLGPSWVEMTPRQRLLYGVPGGLSESELDALWGERGGEGRSNAA